MSSTTAPHTIEVLKDIFATHGYPRLLFLNNGIQSPRKLLAWSSCFTSQISAILTSY